jgi:intein/homing endonuclease
MIQTLKCNYCGDKFERESKLIKYKNNFCSNKCFTNSNIKPLKTLKCDYCGNEFKRKKKFIRSIHNFCNHRCYTNSKIIPIPINNIIEDYKNGETLHSLSAKYKIGYGKLWKKMHLHTKVRDKSYGKVPVNLKDSYDLWYIVGVCHGDGSVYKFKHHQCKNANFYKVDLSVKDKIFADSFKNALLNIGFKNIGERVRKAPTYNQGFCYNVCVDSKTFYEWYKKLTYNKMLMMNKKYKIAFLRGLFESDGCFCKMKYPQATITNAKKPFLKFVQKMVSDLGFKSSIYYKKGGYCPSFNSAFKSGYILSVIGGSKQVLKFVKMLDCCIERKRVEAYYKKFKIKGEIK